MDLFARPQPRIKTTTPATTGRIGFLQRRCACGGTPGLDGECLECRRKRLQRQSVSQIEPASAPPIVHEALRSPGQPLDPATRALFEPRFGHDFSQVRVHTDSQAAESARAVKALAYTVGQDVVFGAGQYQPQTSAGRKLLAHELTHVVQQTGTTALQPLSLDAGPLEPLEIEARQSEDTLGMAADPSKFSVSPGRAAAGRLYRRVIPENVSCHTTGLTNPDLTGDEVVATLQAADAEAITLALRAELLLELNLLLTQAGEPVDAEFDTILQEELGLTLTNPAHFPLVAQQRDRFRRVRETLESGYLRYICRGDRVTLVGCSEGTCGQDFAFSCPGNRLIVLCQTFWDNPGEQAATLLHEPFHIWFHMARHAPNALRRADASCFESFALRLAGQAAPASCAGHTAG
jgi:hypothetical protein